METVMSNEAVAVLSPGSGYAFILIEVVAVLSPVSRYRDMLTKP
jgi:hypothetical protein